MAKRTKAEQKQILDITIYDNNNEEIEAAKHNTMLTDFIESQMNEREPAADAALNMRSHKVVAVTDPTDDQDAATKKYVDDNAGGLPTSGNATTANGTAVDLGGAQPNDVTITKADAKTFKVVSDPGATNRQKLILSDSELYADFYAATQDFFATMGFEGSGAAVDTGGGMYMIAQDLTGNIVSAFSLNANGIIKLGDLTGDRWSHIQVTADNSARIDALDPAVKELVIPHIKWLNDNLLQNLSDVTAKGAFTDDDLAFSSSSDDVLNFSSAVANANRGVAFNGRLAMSAHPTDGFLRINNKDEFVGGSLIEGDVTINGDIVANNLTGDQTYDLSNWDMTTAPSKVVGLDLFPGATIDITKVVSYSVIIFDDNLTVASDISWTANVSSAPMLPQGTAYLTSTDVQIIRLDGGLFDNANYDGSGLRARINIKSTP